MRRPVCILLCLLAALGTRGSSLQAQEPSFPKVSAVTLVDEAMQPGFRLSNNRRFEYRPSGLAEGSTIVDTQSTQAFPKNSYLLGSSGRTNPAGWSVHDARFVEVDPGIDCAY